MASSEYRVSLEPIREGVRDDFQKWIDATNALFAAADQAKLARASIAARARSLLRSAVNFSSPGLYLFLDSGAGDADGAIIYIGLVKARVGDERLLDYLTKQISLLDPGLRGLTAEEAEKEIDRRLTAGMLGTRPETRRSYVPQHLKSRNLAKADAILVHAVDASPSKIEKIESTLIGSIVHLTRDDRSLVNVAKIKGAWPPSALKPDVGAAALEVIGGWKASGLKPHIAADWQSEIARALRS